MSVVARLEQALRPDRELAALVDRSRGAGAIVSFVGIARPGSKQGRLVDRLVLDCHPSLTLGSLEEIAGDALEKFDVSHIHVVHRSGEIPASEPIVFAGAAAAHRRAAFDAADYLMDRLKTEAVFWKREVGGGCSEWIEPTDDDYASRERWS